MQPCKFYSKLKLSFCLLFCKGLFAAASPDGSYGGVEGNEVFQGESESIVRCMEQMLPCSEFNFQDFVEFSGEGRARIAEKAESRDRANFGALRSGGLREQIDMTPLFKRPEMMQGTRSLFERYKHQADWMQLDSNTRLRCFIGNYEQCFKEYTQPDNLYNYIHVVVYPGHVQSRKVNSYYLDNAEGNLSLNPDGSVTFDEGNLLLPAIMSLTCHVAFLEVQTLIDDQWLTTRSFMCPVMKDELDNPNAFATKVPVLLHPACGKPQCPGSYGQHMHVCEQLFNEAHCFGEHRPNDVEVTIKIAKFAYWWFITMPAKRGSASMGEWFVQAFCGEHGLEIRNPEIIKKLDAYAQTSLTFEEFLPLFNQLFL